MHSLPHSGRHRNLSYCPRIGEHLLNSCSLARSQEMGRWWIERMTEGMQPEVLYSKYSRVWMERGEWDCGSHICGDKHLLA